MSNKRTNCNKLCTREIAIKQGFYRKVKTTSLSKVVKGFNLTKAIQDMLNACGLECPSCPKYSYILTEGSAYKIQGGKRTKELGGLFLNAFVKDSVYQDCLQDCDCCTQPCVTDVLIREGIFREFRSSRGMKGLHLNRVIRDIANSCGADCYNCGEKNCYAKDCPGTDPVDPPRPTLDLVDDLLGNRTIGVFFTFNLASNDLDSDCIPIMYSISDLDNCLVMNNLDGTVDIVPIVEGTFSFNYTGICVDGEVTDTALVSGTSVSEPVVCEITNVTASGVCNGTSFDITTTWTDLGTSGNLEVDVNNEGFVPLVSGGVYSIANSTAVTGAVVTVRDTADNACFATTTVDILECVLECSITQGAADSVICVGADLEVELSWTELNTSGTTEVDINGEGFVTLASGSTYTVADNDTEVLGAVVTIRDVNDITCIHTFNLDLPECIVVDPCEDLCNCGTVDCAGSITLQPYDFSYEVDAAAIDNPNLVSYLYFDGTFNPGTVVVDWGDGNTSNAVAGVEVTNNYANGTYVITATHTDADGTVLTTETNVVIDGVTQVLGTNGTFALGSTGPGKVIVLTTETLNCPDIEICIASQGIDATTTVTLGATTGVWVDDGMGTNTACISDSSILSGDIPYVWTQADSTANLLIKASCS